MKFNPYLNFDGNAKEAMEFYKSVFGGEFNAQQKFSEIPPQEGVAFPEEEKNRIMHISLPLGDDNFLMASDISPSQGHKLNQGNNVYISLTPDTLEEAKRIYKELSNGGKIEMEFQKMFWGDYFASFTDKFGVMWMINIKAEEGEEK